jgi:hypothetical protein
MKENIKKEILSGVKWILITLFAANVFASNTKPYQFTKQHNYTYRCNKSTGKMDRLFSGDTEWETISEAIAFKGNYTKSKDNAETPDFFSDLDDTDPLDFLTEKEPESLRGG